jgi:hypothetical protein
MTILYAGGSYCIIPQAMPASRPYVAFLRPKNALILRFDRATPEPVARYTLLDSISLQTCGRIRSAVVAL